MDYADKHGNASDLQVNTGKVPVWGREQEKSRRAPVSGDKILGRGSPVRQSQVQQLRVDALKDTGIIIELGDGFVW